MPARPRGVSTPAVAMATVIVALVALLQPVSPTAPTAPALPGASSPAQGSETWPAGLAEAASSAMAADAYAIVPQGGDWRATNAHQALEATFSASGLSVTSSDDTWSFGLSTTGLGRGEALAPVAPAEVVADGGRIDYRRGGLTEWYVNDAGGIEQGFTLSAPPSATGEGPVVVEMGLSGNVVPRLSDDARGLVLADAAGAEVARFDGLVAFDATGADLGAHMELVDGALRLVVDDAGAAYPPTIDPTINTQQAKLTASDAASNDHFGGSVAISGDTAVVGARLDEAPGTASNTDSGSAYVFVRSGDTWSQQAKLTASDAAFQDYFGWSVAVSGDTIVVGASQDDDAGTQSGSAYVFVRSGTTWSQQAKLTASDAAAADLFGFSVAISGDTIVVGAYRDDDAVGESGSAYVFVRSGTTWSQQAKLTATDPGFTDFLGWSVAISGDTIVVGARLDDAAAQNSGSAYVFVRSGATWSQQAKLTPSDAALNDEFGYSVAVSGDTAVVGTPFDDDAGNESGSAYVFVRSGTTWSQQAKLTAADAAANDRFGFSVAVSGDTVVVGAYGDDDAGTDSGSAYVFVRSGTTWSQRAKLTASDATVADQFGISVAVSGDTAVAGARGDESAYVFVPGPSSILSVVRNGTGTGTVTSDPAGIDCGADCEEDFAEGTTVTLTATPAPGSTFTGFGGCDSVTDNRCTVTVDAANTVTATFTQQATTTTSSTSTTSTTLPPTTTTSSTSTTSTTLPPTTTTSSTSTTSTTLPPTTTTSSTSTTSTTLAPGGTDFFDETALSNGTVARLTGSFTCEVGRRFKIEVTLTQGDVVGRRIGTGRCTGEPVDFRMRVRGSGFVTGTAQIEGRIQVGTPGVRTIDATFAVDEAVFIQVPSGFAGTVVNALLATGL